MSDNATSFAVLSVALAILGAICGSASGGAGAFRESSSTSAAATISVGWPNLARLLLGLSCLFAILACVELWLAQDGSEESIDTPQPSAWGALWVCAALLALEWRIAGLASVGWRMLSGAWLGGIGVLAVGVGFDLWLRLIGLPMPSCTDGNPTIEASGMKAIAAFAMTLVLIAGPSLRRLPVTALPLSTVAAGVAIAVWMQPVLPALGWLPLSIGGGGPLALVLSAALLLLMRGAGRGRWGTILGLVAYFVFGVGGCLALGTL